MHKTPALFTAIFCAQSTASDGGITVLSPEGE